MWRGDPYQIDLPTHKGGGGRQRYTDIGDTEGGETNRGGYTGRERIDRDRGGEGIDRYRGGEGIQEEKGQIEIDEERG